jgi:hypothetical protein
MVINITSAQARNQLAFSKYGQAAPRSRHERRTKAIEVFAHGCEAARLSVTIRHFSQ